MRKIILFLFIVVCCIPQSVKAQFEGVIDLKHTFGDGEQARESLVSMLVKDKMMAFKPSQGVEQEGRVIYRGEKQVMWVIDDKKQSYIEFDISHQKQPDEREGMETAKPEKAKATIHKTGKKETILGYPCEEIVVEDSNEVRDIWATTKLGNLFEGLAKSFGQMTKNQQGNLEEWRADLMKMNAFPLKSISTIDGKVTEKEEITKIEKKLLASSIFELPEGYKKQSFELPADMMKQMQEQMKNNNGGKKNGEQNIDVQKMMKDLQEKLKNIQKEKDSTKDKDNE